MKAAKLLAPKEIKISETDLPIMGENEVLIRSLSVGICGSDTSYYLGHRKPQTYPWVLGHEVVGQVAAFGDSVTGISVGQRVIVEPNYPCGVCTFCRTSRGNICPNKESLGITLNGCFTEQFVAPAEYVWAVPDGISNDDAVTIEPLTVSLHALWNSGDQSGDVIAVLGCGATGLLLIQAAISEGLRVIAHDQVQSKMDLARQMGAEIYPGEEIARLWQTEGVTTVFECAGAAATAELAINSAPRGSQVILIGLSSSEARFVPFKLVREGLRLSGSFIYNHPNDFARAIELVKRKVLSPGTIVSNVFPFNDIRQALELASSGNAGKILVTISDM
jgi:threonine dehydrogenase-like Zn-dependent dehydrogenase